MTKTDGWIFPSLLLVSVTGLWAGPVAVEPSHSQRDRHGTAVFLFEYEALPGQQAQFESGYRRHLDWHRQANDPLDWFAWTVATGPRSGRFIDGTFNLSFGDFDRRVDPAADRIDFVQHVAPFARLISRSAYRLRADLGTVRFPTGEAPAPMIEASMVKVRVGGQAQFERSLGAVRSALLKAPNTPRISCYQLVSGGEQPSYLLLLPRTAWSEYDQVDEGLAALFAGAPSDAVTSDSGDSLSWDSVERITTETWAYREDLAYVAKSSAIE